MSVYVLYDYTCISLLCVYMYVHVQYVAAVTVRYHL